MITADNAAAAMHSQIQRESGAGYKTAMRKCEGAKCNRMRSIAQFVGDSTLCIRCVRSAPSRAPSPTGAVFSAQQPLAAAIS